MDTIWKGCLLGDRKAQFQLYQAMSDKMLGVCMRYATQVSEAEEILQAGFIKVFTKCQLFENKGSLEGWIRRIMVNTAIEWYRGRNKNGFESLSASHPVYDNSTGGEDKLHYKDLLSLIKELPIGYRTVFNLYAVEGYSHKEIAEMMEISEGNSKSQLSRARQWLKERLVSMENIKL